MQHTSLCFRRGIISVASAILFFCLSFMIAHAQVQPQGSAADCLDVMSINLLFSEVEERDDRLAVIAAYLEDRYTSGSPVDVVMLQEVVGGVLSDTRNSARDLRSMLSEKGIQYNLRYRMANGISGLLSVGNAVLSLHEITLATARTLPFVSEEIFDGFSIYLRRSVMMARITTPQFGPVDIYNTHLCPFCDEEERSEQAQVTLNFIASVENVIPGENPVILGGDFNIPDNSIPSGGTAYDLILGQGFTDTYATANACTTCCNQTSGQGCTFAVPGNPYGFDLFTGDQETPERLDYIFTRDFNEFSTIESTIVFNAEPDWVSDHSAVLTTVCASAQ